ncbi:MAG TPA: methyltransferase domain-containing protein [Gemmatimonadaceae bacterium]|nr:methyltransferase domain-containing protein [Gemmatimonadaceae bacterium]
MPELYGRPSNSWGRLPSFINEAARLRAFKPPFRFTDFFSPEDTLLCVIASEAALARARLPGASMQAKAPLRIIELTSGSGLIGIHLLRIERHSELVGIDVDESAVETARENAAVLGVARRAMFIRGDMKSRHAMNTVSREKPDLLVCNPPYIPEPPGTNLAVEAGAGPSGTAHIMRTLELAHASKPRALALSWCSLSDPEEVVLAAERAGYRLNSLFITVIADGEYSGKVEEYLRGLDGAFMNSQPETLRVVAPDGSASFGFLLMAGEFSRSSGGPRRENSDAAKHVRTICARFARRGIASLESIEAPFAVRTWLLDRWDEVRLRAFLHGRDGEPANEDPPTQ